MLIRIKDKYGEVYIESSNIERIGMVSKNEVEYVFLIYFVSGKSLTINYKEETLAKKHREYLIQTIQKGESL